MDYDDDFILQPKTINGIKLKGCGGGSKKNVTKRKKSSNKDKELYNSKHIRIMSEKIDKGKQKRPNTK